MIRIVRATLSALLLLTCLLPASPIAHAEEYVCQDALGAVTVDNLRVPPQASCVLDGTTVQGTLKVETGAQLNAQAVNVIGNIQAEGAASVTVAAGSTVGGSIQIKQGSESQIDQVQVTGDIQFEVNDGELRATANTVGGSVQVFQNTGGVAISGNTIDGNLQCKENDPAPTGGANTVQGNKEDQCAQLENEDVFVPNQVVVKLDLQQGAAIESINDTYGTSTLDTLLSSGGIYLLQTPPNIGMAQLVEQMGSDVRLIYAEPNFYGELPEGGSRGKWAWGGSDPSPVGTQYATTLLRLSEAHVLSRGGQVIVAVLDTGFQLDHPTLDGRLTPARYDFVDDDAVPDEDFANLDRNGDGFVDESAGHGTHVAGIVSLAAPDAQIMPLRVLDASGRGNVFLIAEAVEYATEHGAQVINLSLGARGQSRLLGEVIEDALTTHDVLVVAAAGNLNSADHIYPAAAEPALAVTAVDSNQQKPDFANYGPWVDIAAPGTEIYSAFPINSNVYWSGTSMATPFIAGQAALLHSRYPSLSALDVRQCILATAQPLAPELGAGLADFVTSLTVTNTGCAIPDPGGDGAGVCQSTLGAVTVENLLVPPQASCVLDGTTVQGTLKVESGATLHALQVNIIGNVQAESAAEVKLTAGSTVGGSIQIKRGSVAQINDVHVNGDLQFESNREVLRATGNTVGGSVQVFLNTGGVIIAGNRIAGNLQCKENDPAPTGGNNTVQGNQEDQCAQLDDSIDTQNSDTGAFVVVARLYLPLVLR